MNSNFTTSHRSRQAENPEEMISNLSGLKTQKSFLPSNHSQITQATLKSQFHGDDADPEKENKNKTRFISALKEYIKLRKGKVIFEQIDCQLPSSLFILSNGGQHQKEFEDELVFDGYRKQASASTIDLSNGTRSDATVVDLELDLMDMILYDPFLGENFIKCLFRYYSHLTDYVKEIFLEMFGQHLIGESRSPTILRKLE